MVMIRKLKHISNSRGWGITSKEPMWTFDVNYVTQNNIYVPAVIRDCCGAKMSLPSALHYQNLMGYCRSHKLLLYLPCNAEHLVTLSSFSFPLCCSAL